MFARSLICLASATVALALVGCVPYQTYKQTQLELEKAKEANIDLSKKYNDAMMKLMQQGKGGVVDDSALQAQLARLLRENETLRQRALMRPEFTPEEIRGIGVPGEDGGLQLGEELLFSEGSATLKPSAFPTLDRIVDLIQTNYRNDMITIEGHTDNQPLQRTLKRWGYNMRLGYERANAVFEYFINHGIPESRMKLETHSFNKPTDASSANTDTGRAQNRRVVVRRGRTEI